METKELFDLLERCSSLSIRGNTKAIQQATALLARIQELETAIEKTLNTATGYALFCKRIMTEESVKELAALLNNTPLEKE